MLLMTFSKVRKLSCTNLDVNNNIVKLLVERRF